ncbi:unnamed protein product [Didymodactylos carnosus]|uniref:Cytochrome P450 n=1 Tax=Didymodactylos carnosus TaxID=1234261 RepID=A0A815G3F5_9BILA|nr:unnamed protein product [Didymodactylos carnosus]CAF4189145.1 unnamed protein product [Didymodactylos carnosus]
MLFTLILYSIILILIITFIIIYVKQYEYFKARQIPGPTPSYFFGNVKTLWNAESPSRQLVEWSKQFGKIYGIFEGTRPHYIVSDVDFLQEVFIKQFSHFPIRKTTIFSKALNKGKRIHLFSALGTRWKRQRNVINPTFSAVKLKQMSPLINNCINELMKKLPDYSEKHEDFNIYVLYKRLTMDVICRCAFGVDTDMQNNPDNIYLKKVGQAFSVNFQNMPLFKLGTLVPPVGVIVGDLFIFQNKVRQKLNQLFPSTIKKFEPIPGTWIMARVGEVIEMRSDVAKQRVDLLQLMLEAASREQIKDKKDDVDEQYIAKKLTYDEVIANVFLFMIAGYETTSTALAYCTYVLANHPEEQLKLQEEIDEYLLQNEDEEDPDYDVINRMPYMDMVIKEVLRMHPIAISGIMNRECTQETDICGIKITKGAIVQPDVYSIHYDQELWGPQDVNNFCPERHLTKRHPLAFLAFGVGPRNYYHSHISYYHLNL